MNRRAYRTMGAGEFPGQFGYDVTPAPAPARKVVQINLPTRAPAPTTTTAPTPITVTAPVPAPAPPATTPATQLVCPPVWPWWWMVVAAGLGAAGGVWVASDRKRAKKNAGRIVHRIVNAGARSVFGF